MTDAFLTILYAVFGLYVGYVATFGAYHLILWVHEGNLKGLINDIFGEYYE